MKLIQLKNSVKGFASIDFAEIDMNAVLKEGKVELLQGKNFKWNMTSGDKISDCPFYIGAMPIFDTNKLNVMLKSINAKTATFEVEGRSYTIVAANHFEGEIINKEASEIRTFRSGKIMSISKYVFKSGIEYPNLFTPQEFVLATFCSLEIAQQLLSCHFAQLEFSECAVN